MPALRNLQPPMLQAPVLQMLHMPTLRCMLQALRMLQTPHQPMAPPMRQPLQVRQAALPTRLSTCDSSSSSPQQRHPICETLMKLRRRWMML